jgi:VWFA-related protein
MPWHLTRTVSVLALQWRQAKRIGATAFLCGVALGLASVGLCAQESASDQAFHLKAGAQLVLVDVSVEWKRTGQPITGLVAADFLIAEDGVPQPLSSVSEDVLPLSLVFLFDLTDTVHPVIQHLANGAAEVLHHLRPQDEVSVMTFSSHTKLEQRFTRDRLSAVEGIDAASASYDRNEPTFLFEDLWQAVQVSSASRVRDARRVQVWVTDGSANDQDAQRELAKHAAPVLHTQDEATEALLRSGAVVSALIEHSSLRGTGRFGDVEHFADLTGGPVVYATEGDAAERLSTLLDTLRARYTLGYKPGQMKAEGTLCRLKVSLSPAFWAAHPQIKGRDVLVRARQSYIRVNAEKGGPER